MAVAQLVGLTLEGLLVIIAGVAAAGFLRHRDRTRLDILLICGSPALLLILQQAAIAGHARPGVVRMLGALVVVPQPYLLVRLAQHFRRVPRLLHAGALAGFLAAAAIIAIAPLSRAPLWTGVILAYVVLAAGYATATFVRGARATSGVTHWRLLLIACGAALLALALTLSGIHAIAPATAPYTLPGVSIGLAAALVVYYIGFVPPRLLRAAWVLPELRSFLVEEAKCPPAERGSWMNVELCKTAVRSVGGLAAVVALADAGTGQLVVRASAGTRETEGLFDGRDTTVEQAWETRRPAITIGAGRFGPNEARLAAGVQAGALLAMPILSRERAWGVLIVWLRWGLLFAGDDVALLQLFTDQTAIALDYAALVAEQATAAEALRRTAADLKAANAELEAFSYSVSHDLRAPLRHVAGFAQLLEQAEHERLADSSRRHLQTIVEAAARMGRLIDALLTFSRTGRVDLQPGRVAMADLARGIQVELQAQLQGRRCVWAVGELPEVDGDPVLLRLALFNLVSNAVKYTRGRETAEITIGSRPGAPGEVVVYVRDNGAGFDMRYVDKLFGVFQRLHTEDQFEGTGIGLANVRRIVHRHGGRVWAEGAADRGATFYMALPATAGDAS